MPTVLLECGCWVYPRPLKGEKERERERERGGKESLAMQALVASFLGSSWCIPQLYGSMINLKPELRNRRS